MINERYDFKSSEDYLNFEFESVGPVGIIKKVVNYTKISTENIYNLGFGDKNETTGFTNDLSVTNNQDSRKVLATVARTLYVFIEHYPNAVVIATGSTKTRTRLYQMGIANNLDEIKRDFDILGDTGNIWEPFRRNITYRAFLIRRKRIVL